MEELTQLLHARFDASRCGDFDATFSVHCGNQSLTLQVAEQALRIVDAPGEKNDFTLFFEGESDAIGVFSGTTPPLDAFMAGGLRSSGYIMWVFHTLGIFSKPY